MTTYAICKKCRQEWSFSKSYHCPVCGPEEVRRSSVFPQFNITVFNRDITCDITGEPVKLRNARDEEKMCIDYGCAPKNDFKESSKKSRERREKLHEKNSNSGEVAEFVPVNMGGV